MNQETVWVINSLLTPPGALLLLGLLSLMLGRGLAGKLILLVSLSALYLLSTPYISRQLLAGLESVPALPPTELTRQKAQVIVVLGGGRYIQAPEYGEDTVSVATLERIRYAAWLARRTGLQVIPSGGRGHEEGRMEAEIARDLLEQEFGVKVRAVENRSRTTWENAQLTGQLLKQLGIDRILLVTHAWHMPRALKVFQAQGIDTIPAPMGFNPPPATPTFWHWMPNAQSLQRSAIAAHEYVGQLWYWLKNGAASAAKGA